MIEVIRQVKNESKNDAHKKFLVRCSCGKEYVINSQQVKKTTMCVDCARCITLKLGPAARRKDFTIYKTRLYHIWAGMKGRCYNHKCPAYKNYGGRGIEVCKDWLESPFRFYAWAIKNGYNDGLSIDRIDNNGNYCPENCRFASAKTQANNRSTNHIVCYKGKNMTLSEWADVLGLSYACLKSRIQKFGVCEKAFYKGLYKTNGQPAC